MTWHPHFQPEISAGWKSTLELKHEQEHTQQHVSELEAIMPIDVLSKVKKTRFLTKEDCRDGIVLTIERIEEQRIDPGDPDTQMVVYFKEPGHKPMILNSTNTKAIINIVGSRMDTDWVGHRIECYNNPNVSFAGEQTGGIRVRPPKAGNAPANDAASQDIPL